MGQRPCVKETSSANEADAGRLERYAFRSPLSRRSHRSQHSPRACFGRTRWAKKCAAKGRLVPVPHDTYVHAVGRLPIHQRRDGPVPARLDGPDRLRRPTPEPIDQSAALQGGTERGHTAILGVRDHPVEREAGGPDLPDLREADAPLLAVPQRGGNPGALPPGLVVRPLLREIELQRQRPRQPVRPQRARHRHLAIGHFAHRATVLPRDADRVSSLFGKARLVQQQQPRPHRHHLAQPLPERRRRPQRMGDEVLQPLVGAGIGEAAVHGLHRLPLAVVEQAFDVATGIAALDTPAQAPLELIEKCAE